MLGQPPGWKVRFLGRVVAENWGVRLLVRGTQSVTSVLSRPWYKDSVQVVASLRASDSDREQVAERLLHATAEGRLSGDELDQRLEALYTSRTYDELDALLADLPIDRAPRQPRVRLGRLIAAASAVTLVLALLGALAIMRVRSAVAVLGTGHSRHVNFPGPLAGPHQGLITAASLGVVFVVLLTSAAVLWVVMGSSSRAAALNVGAEWEHRSAHRP